jgi:hypothetical protein
METELLVVTLGLDLLGFINIDNSPSLVGSVMSLVDDNLLSFSVLTLVDIKHLLVSDVDEVSSSVSEDLPMVRVSTVDSDFL